MQAFPPSSLHEASSQHSIRDRIPSRGHCFFRILSLTQPATTCGTFFSLTHNSPLSYSVSSRNKLRAAASRKVSVSIEGGEFSVIRAEAPFFRSLHFLQYADRKAIIVNLFCQEPPGENMTKSERKETRSRLLSRHPLAPISLAVTAAFIWLGILIFGCDPLPKAFELDLRSETTDEETDYVILIGSLSDAQQEPGNVVLSIAHWIVDDQQRLMSTPKIVAFIESDKTSIQKIWTVQGAFPGEEYSGLDILVKHPKAEFWFSSDQTTYDPLGIMKDFANQYEFLLTQLNAEDAFEMAFELFDDSRVSLSQINVMDGTVRQTCNIPPDDDDVRFGRGYYYYYPEVPTHGPYYRESRDLYVCSEGVRVCVFNDSFLRFPVAKARINLNDRTNTLLLSEYGNIYTDTSRYCTNGTSSFEMYKIDGWIDEDLPDGWKASFEMYGHEGNDWINGTPNSGDRTYGGGGNDLLIGGGGAYDEVYGEEGFDSMHGTPLGICDGGPPIETATPEEAAQAGILCGEMWEEWTWPNEATDAIDCCCAGCGTKTDCGSADGVGGGPAVIPDPW